MPLITLLGEPPAGRHLSGQGLDLGQKLAYFPYRSRALLPDLAVAPGLSFAGWGERSGGIKPGLVGKRGLPKLFGTLSAEPAPLEPVLLPGRYPFGIG
jgi:hypothetical protein